MRPRYGLTGMAPAQSEWVREASPEPQRDAYQGLRRLSEIWQPGQLLSAGVSALCRQKRC